MLFAIFCTIEAKRPDMGLLGPVSAWIVNWPRCGWTVVNCN